MTDFAVRQSIEAMEEYAVESVAADVIVNANESNYPLPEEITAKVVARTARFPFNRYPPMKAENLCEVIAKELDVDIDCVKVGNGSSELLEKACYVFGGPGKKIAVPWPSFSMYGEYAALSDSEEIRYPLTEDGYVDADAVISFCKEQQPSLLIICNPNNPTGNYNSLKNMEKILANVSCPVIMDEAYMEFADGKELAPNDMRPLGKALLPYHVNAYTLMVAKTVYENKNLYKERIREIRAERDKLVAAFKELGFRVWPTATNFVTFRAEGELMQKLAQAYNAKYKDSLAEQAASGKLIFKYYMENSILVRDFTTHPVLTGCLRITVGLPEENEQLISKLQALCAEVKA